MNLGGDVLICRRRKRERMEKSMNINEKRQFVVLHEQVVLEETSPDTRTWPRLLSVPTQFSVASCLGTENQPSTSDLRSMFAFQQ